MAGPVVTPHDATKTRVFRVAPRPFPGVTDLSVERPVETQAHRALLMAVEQEPRERKRPRRAGVATWRRVEAWKA